MTALKALGLFIGVPALFGVTGAAYLLGMHALLKRCGIDTHGPWFATSLVGSFVALLYLLSCFLP